MVSGVISVYHDCYEVRGCIVFAMVIMVPVVKERAQGFLGPYEDSRSTTSFPQLGRFN